MVKRRPYNTQCAPGALPTCSGDYVSHIFPHPGPVPPVGNNYPCVVAATAAEVFLEIFLEVALKIGGRCFSGYASGDGDHTDAFSSPRSTKCPVEVRPQTSVYVNIYEVCPPTHSGSADLRPGVFDSKRGLAPWGF